MTLEAQKVVINIPQNPQADIPNSDDDEHFIDEEQVERLLAEQGVDKNLMATQAKQREFSILSLFVARFVIISTILLLFGIALLLVW